MARLFPQSAFARLTTRLTHLLRTRPARPSTASRAYETMSDELERTLIARETRGRY